VESVEQRTWNEHNKSQQPGWLFLVTDAALTPKGRGESIHKREPMDIKLSSALQKRIFEQMEASYPNEGGGFLLGSVRNGVVTIQDITAVENVFEEAEQYHRYAMTPQDWARLEDAAEARGLTLVGYYHSHPDSPAIPSQYDRDHALPNFVYIITSVQAGKAADMRVWRLKADRSAFDADSLQIEE
jgi:proteasome lid subunit RPN8/RPN11